MNKTTDIDYGPLSELIGIWSGDKGIDIAPEADGEENNPYYETITFAAIGDVRNAETQLLAALHYRQIVQRKSNDKIFHDETGYWMWDAKESTIMHSLTIPRGVSLLAGGTYAESNDIDGKKVLLVSASMDDKNWNIVQSPFMQNSAKTKSFTHQITVGKGELSYKETMEIDIYGKQFTHTDSNDLLRQ